MLPGSRAPALAHASPVARAAARRLALRVRAVVDTRIAAPFRKDAEHLAQWSPKSWKNHTAHQQPNYPDAAKLQDAVDTVARMPPLVFAGECRNLQARLAKCAAGEAFLLQGARATEEPAMMLPPKLLKGATAQSCACCAGCKALQWWALAALPYYGHLEYRLTVVAWQVATARRASPSSVPTASGTPSA